MPERASFISLLGNDILDSKPRAAIEIVVSLVGLWGWLLDKANAISPNVTPWLIALSPAVALGLLLFHARNVIVTRERMHAEELDRADRSRPNVLLTYESRTLYGFGNDEIPNDPVQIHNAGDQAAVEIEVEALQLTPTLKVVFAPMPLLATGATSNLVYEVEETTDSGGYVVEKPEHIGSAIQSALTHTIWSGNLTGRVEWPLRLTYRDTYGHEYQVTYTLRLVQPKARAVYVDSQRIK